MRVYEASGVKGRSVGRCRAGLNLTVGPLSSDKISTCALVPLQSSPRTNRWVLAIVICLQQIIGLLRLALYQVCLGLHYYQVAIGNVAMSFAIEVPGEATPLSLQELGRV
jgi:hypothetical protein